MATKSAPISSLIFSWRKAQSTLAVLGSFLVLSTLIHALGFYVFHIVYQPAVSLPPSQANLTIIDPKSPASAPFLAWLDSEDPALVFLPDPVAPDLVELSPKYQSSVSLFETDGMPRLESEAESRAEPVHALETKIPAPLFHQVRRSVSAPQAEPRAIVADVRFDRLQPTDPLKFASSESTVAPAEFMMGIDRSGRVIYLLAERTTGSDELDKQLTARLRATAFPLDPQRSEIFWEKAHVSWHVEGGRP